MLKISIRGDKQLKAFFEEVTDPDLARQFGEAIGVAVEELTREHLRQKDQKPNALGGRRTHFYSSAADSVRWEANDKSVRVQIPHLGIRQRYYGGVITPKAPRKFLAIPVHPLGHGQLAREFEADTGMALRIAKKDKGETAGYLLANIGDDSVAIYVLRRSVTQRPDPTVLPDRDKLRATAINAVGDLLSFLLNDPA